jgi:putative addiction module CopG family antidote
LPQVTLDAETTALIEDQIASGRFRTPSEVVRAGLLLLDEIESLGPMTQLRAGLAARAADGKTTLPADEVFARLRAHHAEAAAEDRGAG